MQQSENLAGKIFGRLTPVKRVENNKFNQVMWLCRCDCGNELIVSSGKLKSSHTKSCGCYNVDSLKERTIKHGETKTRLYYIWGALKNRCDNPNVKGYMRYGGRGIKICEEWRNFEAFKSWAVSLGYDTSAPRGNLTVERIDNNGNYEPSNCKLATYKEQNRNKRSNHIVEYNGEKMCLSDASERAKLPYYLVSERIVRLGWSDYNALHTPRRL